MKFENVGPEDVCEVAEFVAKKIQKGNILLLEGDLGAGKTFFTRCLAKIFQGDETEVTSPTFAIINLYNWQTVKVYHMDFYRLTACQLEEMGLEEILEDSTSIKIVEWPSNFDSWQEYNSVKKIKIEHWFDEKNCEARTYKLEGF